MEKIPSQTEKKMIYGIRSLKNGTGSITSLVPALSCFLLQCQLFRLTKPALKLRKILAL